MAPTPSSRPPLVPCVRLVAAALLYAACSVGCAEDDYTRLYETAAKAPNYDAADIAALAHMGATVVDDGTNFAVYSERAERVHLLLFTDPEAERPTRTFELERFGNVWNIFVRGVGVGQHYGYAAWGPNWPFDPRWYPGSIHGFVSDVDSEGNRFNPNKLLVDPYARALHRDHDWSKGSVASGPARTESTYAAATKGVVAGSSYTWSEAEQSFRAARAAGTLAGHDWNELVVYEVHPKGFTASPASGVAHPGTYSGIAELSGYLEHLGVNAVELMPVQEKPLDGGYWGYQTIGFFAPELSYASARAPHQVIDEWKAMVDVLHQRGIEVILDVVYNHTGEGGLWRERIQDDDVVLDVRTAAQLVNFDPKEVAGLYAFRGFDNAAYYALGDDPGTYWNNTGVGNQMRANHAPFRRLIIDSLRYWVTELHVDGFRFDLAPVLAAKDLDYNEREDIAASILQEIIDDPVLRSHGTRIIAEPWAAGPYSNCGGGGSQCWAFMLGGFPAASDGSGRAWYEWNAHFRDFWRSFINQRDCPGNPPLDWRLNTPVSGAADGGHVLTGTAQNFAWNGRRPYHSVNFITVHDGFTLFDLFSYDEKRNSCGPLNPVCCTDPLSPFCDRDSGETCNRSRNWNDDAKRRQLMRGAFAALLLAHGTPMLNGGDEWMRTQLGNNNAYSSGADNAFNWFDWGTWKASDERARMADFVRGLIHFRRDHAYAFAPSAYGQVRFTWRNAAGQAMSAGDWHGRHVAQHFDVSTAGPELLVLINMEEAWVDFALPDGRDWRRVVDTQAYFDDASFLASRTSPASVSGNVDLQAAVAVGDGSYTVAPYSVVVLEARP